MLNDPQLAAIQRTLDHILEILAAQPGVPQHLWTQERAKAEAARQEAELERQRAVGSALAYYNPESR